MNILVINDNQPLRDTICWIIEGSGHKARPVVSGGAGLALLNESEFAGVLLDMNLAGENGLEILRQIRSKHVRLPVVMLAAAGSVATAVEAMQLGAVDFLEKPFTPAQLHLTVARLVCLKSIHHKITQLAETKRKVPSSNPELLQDFTSPVMDDVRDVLARASKSRASILITGESGTGKSVLAQAIHRQSHLASQPFVTVSCPSLSRELLESELFGHAAGSFTGAIKDRWGKVKAAEGGTLFFDEVGDLPLEIQPKLLRLLQEREYERVGENVTRCANIRVIAATNCDLKKRVAEGLFREDLYFRLNVIAVEMPPLCVRTDDLLPLANHYLQYFGAECGREMQAFSSGTISRMEAHSWPGNLRELRNSIQRGVILAETNQIDADDLLLDLEERVPAHPTPQSGDLISLKELRGLHLQLVVDRAGSIAESARVLGINQATIYRWRKEQENNKSLSPELVC